MGGLSLGPADQLAAATELTILLGSLDSKRTLLRHRLTPQSSRVPHIRHGGDHPPSPLKPVIDVIRSSSIRA